MARPLPRTTETERWYRVRGKRRRPRVIFQPTEGRQDPPPEGKIREADRGSSPDAAPADKGNRRRREGSGEGERTEPGAYLHLDGPVVL